MSWYDHVKDFYNISGKKQNGKKILNAASVLLVGAVVNSSVSLVGAVDNPSVSLILKSLLKRSKRQKEAVMVCNKLYLTEVLDKAQTKEKIKFLKDEDQKMRTVLDALDEKLTQLMKDIERKHERITLLQTNAQTIQMKHAELKKEQAMLIAHEPQTKEKIAFLEDEDRKIRMDLDALKKEQEMLIKHEAQIKEKIAFLEDEDQTIRMDLDALKKEQEMLIEHEAQIKEQIQILEDEDQTIRIKLVELKKEQEMLIEHEAQIELLKDNDRAVRMELNEQIAEQEELISHETKIKDEIESIQVKLAALKKEQEMLIEHEAQIICPQGQCEFVSELRDYLLNRSGLTYNEKTVEWTIEDILETDEDILDFVKKYIRTGKVPENTLSCGEYFTMQEFLEQTEYNPITAALIFQQYRREPDQAMHYLLCHDTIDTIESPAEESCRNGIADMSGEDTDTEKTEQS